MIKVKDNKQKEFVPKRTITIPDVKVGDGVFVDEEGNIFGRVLEKLPLGKDTVFTLKIIADIPCEGSESL